MEVLDLGCGDDLDRRLPGADTCELNPVDTDVTYYELDEVHDASYDLVFTRYAFRLDGKQDETVAHLWRITKEHATIVFTDHMSFIDWDSGEEPEVPFDEYLEWLKKKFNQWNFDNVSVGWEANTITVIMTRGWG